MTVPTIQFGQTVRLIASNPSKFKSTEGKNKAFVSLYHLLALEKAMMGDCPWHN